jgi:hypothetical protein
VLSRGLPHVRLTVVVTDHAAASSSSSSSATEVFVGGGVDLEYRPAIEVAARLR